MSATLKLTVAYDGGDFVGWQRQAEGVSIQGLIEDALGVLDGAPVTVVAAGRTDAGVHALGQVVSCTLSRDISSDVVARALNAHLPPTVRVVSAAAAPAGFHARYHARAKMYRYRIWNGAVVSPFERRYVWHLTSPLDVDAMDRAAQLLEGRHDFAVFQGTGAETRTTERTIRSSRMRRLSDPLVVYEVTGDGFLRHMVRSIVGTLVEIGRGRWPADYMRELLETADRSRVGRTAPAEGLFLVSVEYGDL